MQVSDKLIKPLTEAKYLNADNVSRYRCIMRIFFEHYEKLKYWLYQEEVYEEMIKDPFFADYRPEQCQQDLTMLTEWKNLNTIQDTKKVASIEEFKNKKYRYQMTEYSVEIERLVLRLENLFIEGASLEPTLLERIRRGIERFPEMGERDKNEVYTWWTDLNNDFVRLNQNYQDYLRDFYSGKTEKLMKSVEFMVHKDKFIKYLNEFVQELQRHSKRMEQLLEKNTECMENTVLERVVASELDIPHALLEIHGNAEPSIRENVYGKWYSLKNWFVDGRGQECEAKKVLKITSDIIRNIIQNAALIVQVQNWGISRKDDYKKFLELFLKCEDLEEAHKLSAHVFGVQQIEHYKTNIPRDEDGINNSVYQEEPAMFLLKPHTRGYRERKDRTGFADKSLEKMAQRESYLRQAQKQKEVVLRYIREQKIRFAEIDEVVSEDTRAIFLQWIAQANMSSEKTGRTEYGQEYQMKRKDGSCVLKCEDGDLKMPDYTLEFK